jgi:hypothetical protein
METGEEYVEELKKLDELTRPDDRQHFFGIADADTGDHRALAVSDLYSSAASLKLHDGVPGKVRSHFAAVKNLVAYSWFYYPFNTTAQFLSYVSVEFALRVRLGASPQEGFRSLIRRAVEQKLISDEGFSHIKPAAAEEARIIQALNLSPAPSRNKTYVETLIEVLPELRNNLAHGAHMVRRR